MRKEPKFSVSLSRAQRWKSWSILWSFISTSVSKTEKFWVFWQLKIQLLLVRLTFCCSVSIMQSFICKIWSSEIFTGPPLYSALLIHLSPFATLCHMMVIALKEKQRRMEIVLHTSPASHPSMNTIFYV